MVTAEGTVEERHFFADPREHIKRQTHTRTQGMFFNSVLLPLVGGFKPQLRYKKVERGGL